MRLLALILLSNVIVAPATAEVAGLVYDLPGLVEWKIVIDQSDGDNSIKEWIPSDTSIEKTDWLVVEQKLALESRKSAKNFLQDMMELSKSVCTDVLFNGPEKLVEGGTTTYWGRIMCAQQIGKPYGTFTDLRVIVDEKTAYVVTSEIRTIPRTAAGILAFPEGNSEELVEAWLAQSKQSLDFTRTAIQTCSTTDTDCEAQIALGVSNAQDVLRHNGEPLHIDHNEDGRSVYVYRPDENKMTTYMFDQSGVVRNILNYSK